ERLLSDSLLKLHDYNKEPRPGRKLGHMTWSCESYEIATALHSDEA
ncbi:MAG: hypothetical protein KDD44_08040, partial [Bdellovibrionales bacterium]|nr:hypothetical protein [Bdellovibrionales bacterium]